MMAVGGGKVVERETECTRERETAGVGTKAGERLIKENSFSVF